MDHHRGAHGALNCPVLLRLRGPLDTGALGQAAMALAARHEALRTTFAGRGPRLAQVVHAEPLPLPIGQVDLTGEQDTGVALRRALVAEVQARTEPGSRPVRLTLWRTGLDEHVFCVNMHHLVTDGWSCAVVSAEIARLYARIVVGGSALPPVTWQYRQWAAWHRQQLTGDGLRRLQGYWHAQLDGARLPALPRRDSGVPLAERRTAVERTVLGRDVISELQCLARGRGAAFFSVMLAIYYASLHRETGERDLAVGSVFANRTRREARSTLGFLSNMVMLRTRLRDAMGFGDLVMAANETVIGAFAHQEIPFQMLPLNTIAPSAVRPDGLVFQLLTGPAAPAADGPVSFEPIIDVPPGMGSRWEFELSLAPAGDDLAVMLCYSDDLYDAQWARRFIAGYAELARAAAARPVSSLAALASG
jgi:hypothetical protein